MGIGAGDGGQVIWPLLMGVNRAKWFLMTGERVSGVVDEMLGAVLLSTINLAYYQALMAGMRAAIDQAAKSGGPVVFTARSIGTQRDGTRIAEFDVEWSFKNTNTQSCTRNPDGSITCVSDHPNSFEWCVNQPAVDAAGVVYANSEDGFLYAIGPDGKLRQKIFLDRAIGAAYTPLSLDSAGRIYSQNFGHLFVVGDSARSPTSLPPRSGTRSVDFH